MWPQLVQENGLVVLRHRKRLELSSHQERTGPARHADGVGNSLEEDDVHRDVTTDCLVGLSRACRAPRVTSPSSNGLTQWAFTTTPRTVDGPLWGPRQVLSQCRDGEDLEVVAGVVLPRTVREDCAGEGEIVGAFDILETDGERGNKALAD